MSWKAEVRVVNDEKWYGNSLRFATENAAKMYVSDLIGRWTSTTDGRVTECDDAVTSRMTNRGPVPVSVRDAAVPQPQLDEWVDVWVCSSVMVDDEPKQGEMFACRIMLVANENGDSLMGEDQFMHNVSIKIDRDLDLKVPSIEGTDPMIRIFLDPLGEHLLCDWVGQRK